ncbi:MAG: YdeI/OmpD-associated family protein [Deltaproteobacteria bacterium]|nr:YdeI/OmpD-associated family protein [Deltaproteobacteria bacterium]
MNPPKPTFFPGPAALRRWLDTHHRSAAELWVGLYKKGTGKPTVSWPELVDEVLCVGWIDGIRKSLDDQRYAIRVTPRRPGSTWSEVNVKRAHALIDAGRMRPAGRRAFELRTPERTGVYSYEPGPAAVLEPAEEALFRSDPRAWSHFEASPPSYRRSVIRWVVSAKREATRKRRLAALIANCTAARPLAASARKPTATAEPPPTARRARHSPLRATAPKTRAPAPQLKR